MVGNDGEMAEAGEQGGSEKGSTAKRKQGAPEKADKPVRRAKRGGAEAQDGADRLRWAVDRRLSRDSEKLADVLHEKALTGDLKHVGAVVSLADGKKPKPKKKKPGPTLAEWLTAQPEWKAPADADGDGEREG